MSAADQPTFGFVERARIVGWRFGVNSMPEVYAVARISSFFNEFIKRVNGMVRGADTGNLFKRQIGDVYIEDGPHWQMPPGHLGCQVGDETGGRLVIRYFMGVNRGCNGRNTI